MTEHDLSNLLMLAYMVGLFGYSAYLMWAASERDGSDQERKRPDTD